MPEWIGQIIGKVRIEKFLARGGMAEVYLGTHITLARPVAVKVLHSFIEEEPIPLERFQREARVVATLRHPNIVQVFDFDAIDGHPYIVMEYLKGPTLATYLRPLHQHKKRIPHAQVARLLNGLAAALDYAHERGVIHRDIKPDNILLHNKTDEIPLDKTLPEDVEAVLTDFGLVRLVDTDTHTTTGFISGTPAYMSPEQARGDKIDHRTDIYSLGIVLYELLAGRVPFTADNAAVLNMHLHEMQIHALPPPIPELPARVQAVLDHVLQKNPKDRHQSSLELALDFSRSIGLIGEPVKIQEPEPVPLQEERGTREAVRKARHEALRLAAEKEAVRLKAAQEKTYGEEKKLTPLSPSLLDLRQRRDLRKWAQGAGIVGGLSIIALAIFWLSSTVFPSLTIVPTELTDVVTIASTFTFASTTTPSLTATTTDTPTLSSLPCLKLLMPENSAVLQPTGNITFSWEAMSGANKYRLEIIMPDGTVVSKETQGLSINYSAESIPSAGTYRWQVITFDANDTILCTTAPFSLTKPEYVFPTPIIPRLVPSRTPSLIPTLTPSPTDTDIPTPNPCGILATRVSVGMTIEVTRSGNVARLGIRPQPTLDANKIFELEPGEQMTVLGGPRCSNDSYFWYISSQKGEGWVREGNGVFYFVDPLP